MAQTRPLALKRQMKVTGVLFLTLSAVTPAASVYVIAPGIIQLAGTGALVSLAAAAAISLLLAFVYAELSSAHPITGGEYALSGRTMGPTAGFAVMYATGLTCALSPAVLALGASQYLRVIWPEAPPIRTALVFIALSTLPALLNIRLNAVVTGGFLTLEILILLALASLGLSHPARGLGGLLIHPVTLSHGALTPTPIAALGLATPVAIYAYNGFGVAATYAEEMIGASRMVGRTILLALVVTVLLELVPILCVLIGAPDLKALMVSPAPFSDFVSQRGGRGLSLLISLGVAFAILNALIAVVLVNGRFFYSTGRNQAWTRPVNEALTSLHARFHSPWVATLVAGGLTMAAAFIPLDILLLLTGDTVVMAYGAICLGGLMGRRNGSTDHGIYRMPLFPLAPGLGFLALLYVVYAGWMDPVAGRPSLIITGIMLAAGLLAALLLRRSRGPGWTVKGPADEREPVEI